jgi:hypothetical protein
VSGYSWWQGLTPLLGLFGRFAIKTGRRYSLEVRILEHEILVEMAIELSSRSTNILAKVILKSLPQNFLAYDLCDEACHVGGCKVQVLEVDRVVVLVVGLRECFALIPGTAQQSAFLHSETTNGALLKREYLGANG